MKWFWIVWFALLLGMTGCSRYRQMSPYATTPAPIVVERTKAGEGEAVSETEETEEEDIPEVAIELDQDSVAVKGIYINAFVAGSPTMKTLIDEIDKSEINAVVIDLKSDQGNVTCEMNSPLVTELGTVKKLIPNIEALMIELKARGIYTIARVATFRDPLMAEKKPEWCVMNADGTIFLDNSQMSWINPYKEEAWDYLLEIAKEAKALGFDEVQFDYIRFCTERGMSEVVFAESDVKDRSKTEIIAEFLEYVYEELKSEGLYVSADVFGAVIGSGINADAVGQAYGEMARHLDYISPMIYPSHYADGNFGIEHPDTQPYDLIKAALSASNRELAKYSADGSHIAQVRPWLQDFTADYLENYIKYGPAEVRAQIQATYDTGYDGWMLWNASAKYTWAGLLTPEEAAAERIAIAQSRAAVAAEEVTAASAEEATAASPEETAAR